MITIGGKDITKMTLEGEGMPEGLLGTVDVYGLATSVVVVPPPPPPPPTGDYYTIFEEVDFTDTTNYTPFGYGSITAQNGNFIIGGNSGSETGHGVTYDAWKTGLERYKITTKFKIVDPPHVNGKGFGVGIKSLCGSKYERKRSSKRGRVCTNKTQAIFKCKHTKLGY